MQDADALRTIADSTAVASFVPTLSDVLHRAADALELQDRVIIAGMLQPPEEHTGPLTTAARKRKQRVLERIRSAWSRMR